MTIRPTPPAARETRAGQPRPPAPTTSTDADLRLSCAAAPKPGSDRWRWYRVVSSGLSAIGVWAPRKPAPPGRRRPRGAPAAGPRTRRTWGPSPSTRAGSGLVVRILDDFAKLEPFRPVARPHVEDGNFHVARVGQVTTWLVGGIFLVGVDQDRKS